MKKHYLEVKRTARYFTLGKLSPETESIWFVCHGYGQLAEFFIKKFSILDDGKTYIVAPEGLNRFYLQGYTGRVGSNWMTSVERDRDIKDYIHYLSSLYQHTVLKLNLNKVNINILGFSQGVATVCRWIVDSLVKPDQLVLWGGWFPQDMSTDFKFSMEELNDIPVRLVYGNKDKYVEEEHLVQVKKVIRQYSNIELIEYDGEHNIYPETLKKLKEKS